MTERVSIEAAGVVVDEVRFPGRQGRLVFAYLLAAQGRPVPRDELAEVVWGDHPPARWEKALSVLVSKLRALLSECGVDGANSLTSAFGCYELTLPAGSWIDVDAAADAVERAELAYAAGDRDEARAKASTAAGLARRSFLPGEDGFWVEEQRRDLRDVLVRALECLADASLGAGEFADAVRHAAEVTELEPFRESSYRRLMQAHASAGNPAEALRVYERCRRFLADELGAYPSPETESIYRELLEVPSRPATATKPPDEPQPAPQPRTASRPRRRPGRSRLVVVGAALVLAVTLALVLRPSGSAKSGSPVALAGDSLAVIDPVTSSVIDEVPLGARPAAVAVGGGSVWVVNAEDETLQRIDPKSREVRRTFGLGVRPSDVAVGAGHVWIASAKARAILEFDPIVNEIVATIPVEGSGDVPGPFQVVAGPSAVWAVHGRGVSRINSGGRLMPQIPTRDTYAWSRVRILAVDEKAAWLLQRGGERVVRIEPRTNSVMQSIELDVRQGASAIAVADGALWISEFHGSVLRVDPSRGLLTDIVPLRARGIPVRSALAAGAGGVWAALGDGFLFRIDPRSGTVVKKIKLGAYPIHTAYPTGNSLAFGEGALWVAIAAP